MKQTCALILFAFLVYACAVQVSKDLQLGRAALLSGQPQMAEAHFRRVVEADPDYVVDWSSFQVGIWTYLGRAYYDGGKFAEARQALLQALKRHESDFMARLYFAMTLLRTKSPAAAADKPLTFSEVLYALKERVASKRVAALVKERGVNFDLTAEAEKEIKRAGAEDELVELIRSRATKRRTTDQAAAQQGLKEAETALREIQNWQNRITSGESGRNWDRRKKIRSQVQMSLKTIAVKRTDQPEFLAGLESIGKAIEEEIELGGLR
jgi:tetratricopeptide (TPR) repeat protein